MNGSLYCLVMTLPSTEAVEERLPEALGVDSRPANAPAALPEEAAIMPSLFGCNSGQYQRKPLNFFASVLIHAMALVLILLLGRVVVKVVPEVNLETVVHLTAPVLPQSGGGGGGKHDLLPASSGALPVRSLQQQIAPPQVIVRNDHPQLTAQETIQAPPTVQLPQNNQIGDLNGVLGPASDGRGTGGGIGNGTGTGDGSGRGPASGPGYFHVGVGGVTAPRVIYQPDPEYSEEARRAKYQGTVVVWVVVGPDGKVQDAKIQRHIGLGLDEKALEAVKQWKFEPAQKNGRAVPVAVSVEMSFRLY